jgi:hypothetical protein
MPVLRFFWWRQQRLLAAAAEVLVAEADQAAASPPNTAATPITPAQRVRQRSPSISFVQSGYEKEEKEGLSMLCPCGKKLIPVIRFS